MGFLLLILPATSFLFYVGRGFPKKTVKLNLHTKNRDFPDFGVSGNSFNSD